MPDGIGDRLLILVRGQGEGLPGTRVREPTAICVRSGNIVRCRTAERRARRLHKPGQWFQGPGRMASAQGSPTPSPGGSRCSASSRTTVSQASPCDCDRRSAKAFRTVSSSSSF